MQGKSIARQQPVQREAGLNDEEPALQANQVGSVSGGTVQAQTEAPAEANLTGMPNQLKSGVEALSGMDMSDVRVHRNSDKPAQLNALAYAQGNEIHLGPGQEQHLPHEAWHVVQQRQGRVQATMQMAGAGVGVNDNVGLEREADSMGEKAKSGLVQLKGDSKRQDLTAKPSKSKLPKFKFAAQLYSAAFGSLSNDSGTEVRTDVIAPTDTAGGSNVAAWPNWWPMGAAETANDFLRENFVQGHLLNQKLGGPGNTRSNLTPLTRSTNSQMSVSIENFAKQQLSLGLGIDYWLTADYATHPNVTDVGAGHLPVLEQQKLQIELNKMAGKVGAQISVYQSGNGAWKKLPQNKQPKDMYVKNEGAALKGSFT